MWLLSRFLVLGERPFYGFGMVFDLIAGNGKGYQNGIWNDDNQNGSLGWKESPNFPMITYCDMQIRILGHVQRHTVQCVLVINIFSEKVRNSILFRIYELRYWNL